MKSNFWHCHTTLYEYVCARNFLSRFSIIDFTFSSSAPSPWFIAKEILHKWINLIALVAKSAFSIKEYLQKARLTFSLKSFHQKQSFADSSVKDVLVPRPRLVHPQARPDMPDGDDGDAD